MEYQQVTLYVIAIFNSLFSFFVVRGAKGITTTLFGFVSLAVALWAVNLGFFLQTQDRDLSFMFANVYYISAAAIPLLFLYFSFVFPKNKAGFRSRYLLLSAPLIMLAVAVIFKPDIILSDILTFGPTKNVIINKPAYLIYTLYFLFYVGLSYVYLSRSFRRTQQKTEKTQIKFLVVGTAIAYLFGMIFNLFLPWLGDYSHIWLGPLFSLIMVVTIGYAVIKHHLFNSKIIATETLTFSLWAFILIRTVLSESFQEKVINSFLLVILVIIGTLLIRSVRKEVETREQIQKLAENLKHANARLQELDRQKSEFVSLASHQLKSPLTAIRGYASMVLDGSFGKVPAKMTEAVDRIEKSSGSMVDVIEDFLNITRIEQGRMKYDFVPLDLRDLVKELVDELDPTIKTSGLEFKVDMPKEPMTVVADKGKLRQVILNLIDNAVKYTPKGFVHVKVERTDGHILFSTKDSGIGIPKEFVIHMFGKFNRADNSKRIQANGSGIGLYLAQEILKAHKGRIWAESEGDGKGSTFFVELPVA